MTTTGATRRRSGAQASSRSFGATRAVDGVDLAVPASTVYGVLGPIGAGKTTTIRMPATLLRPDAGTARILGHDVVADADAVRGLRPHRAARVGRRGAHRAREPRAARAPGLGRSGAKARAAALLEAFGLVEAAGRLVKRCSGGMRRRLDIAASIVVISRLLFLDEPTTGLDPRLRNQVWDIIRVLVAQGTTVLLCTQYLDEADPLADRITVIGHGRVIAEGTPAEPKASVGEGAMTLRLADPAQRQDAVRPLTILLDVPVQREADPAALSVCVSDAAQASEAIAELADARIALADFALGRPTLDELLLALTGRPAAPGTEQVAGVPGAAVTPEQDAA